MTGEQLSPDASRARLGGVPAQEREARRRRNIRAWTAAAFVIAAIAWFESVLSHSGDVRLYEIYANRIIHGPLTSGLPKEYPGLASLIFLVPRLAPAAYPQLFTSLMALTFAALLLVRRRAPDFERWERLVVIYLAAGSLLVLFARYDLVPALATLYAVESARNDRWGRAYGGVVIGGLLKIFPLLLLPMFAIVEWRRTGRVPRRHAVVVTVALATFVGIQSLIAPGSILLPLRYLSRRGFEYSSVPGNLTLLLDAHHVHFSFAYGAQEIVGPHAQLIALLVLAIGVAGLVAIARLCARGLSVEAASLATITVAIVANKSFAPQYLVWIAPLWAYWSLRKSWLLAALLTTCIYPILWAMNTAMLHRPVVGYDTAFAALVRNVVLIAGTLAWLFETARHDCRPTGRRDSSDLTRDPGGEPLPGRLDLASVDDQVSTDSTPPTRSRPS